MSKKLILTFAMATIVLASGCKKDEDAKADAAASSAAASAAAAASTGGGDNPLPECRASAGSSTSAGPTTRITLNGDGSMFKVEGRDGNGNWESAGGELELPGFSRGACVARIEIFMHTGETKDLLNSDGTVKHPHSGPIHSSGPAHCHNVVVYQGKTYIYHC